MVQANRQKLVIGMHCKARHHGFTLLEVLVVLIIVAIITAVAVLAFGGMGRSRHEKIVVQEFVRVIPMAQQQAILTPSVLRLNISAEGYQFQRYRMSSSSQQAQWMSLRDDVLSNKNVFHGLFSVDKKSLSDHTILFLPSGYVTPFTVTLRYG